MYLNAKKHIFTFGIPSDKGFISSGQLRVFNIFPKTDVDSEKLFISEEKQYEQIIRTLKNGIRFDLTESINFLISCEPDSTDYIVSDSFATIDSILRCNLYELNSFTPGESVLDFNLIEELKDFFSSILNKEDLEILATKFPQWFKKSPINNFMEAK